MVSAKAVNLGLAIIALTPLAYQAYASVDDLHPVGRDAIICVVISLLGFFFTSKLIPPFSELTEKAGLKGRDINKKGLKNENGKDDLVIPESLGVVPGIVFLCCAIVFQTLLRPTRQEMLIEYNAALLSICFMIFLGFLDDVVELRWRYKLILPTVASLPLLVAYSGATMIVVPIPLREYLGHSLEMGPLYILYMLMLAVFCTNSINIFAGINGLETGQTYIIAISVALHNLIEMGGAYRESHLLSLLLILPFIATTAALMRYNWYPSKVFVGDTFTYFAGMTFAVCGILGHFSKTLLLFFIPQLINFLYSLPQLVGILPCPRHRLPKLNAKTGKLEAVPSHLNLVNLTLLITGPLSERTLCIVLMIFQSVCCAGAFFIRYHVSLYFYEYSYWFGAEQGA